jgi:lipopolysaccharide export LptBFGC system permease protein LptF
MFMTKIRKYKKYFSLTGMLLIDISLMMRLFRYSHKPAWLFTILGVCGGIALIDIGFKEQICNKFITLFVALLGVIAIFLFAGYMYLVVK